VVQTDPDVLAIDRTVLTTTTTSKDFSNRSSL
jgi:hypothetical protein